VKEHDLVREASNEIELMTHEEHRESIRGELVKELERGHLMSDVEERRRLVEDERFALLRQRPREANALPFAAGKILELAVVARQRVHAGAPHRARYSLTVRGTRAAPAAEVRKAPQRDVLFDAKRKGELLALCHDGDAPREGGTVSRLYVLAIDEQPAAAK